MQSCNNQPLAKTTITKRKNVVLATDHNGVQQACVAILSLAKSMQSNAPIRIWVLLSVGVNEGDMKCLRQSINGQYGVEMVFVDISLILEHARDDLVICLSYWPITAFARLFLDVILSDIEGNVLYIDIDTCVADDVSSLLEMDLGENLFAAVPEADSLSSGGRYERLGFTEVDSFYFNSGVMVINLRNYKNAGGHVTALKIVRGLGSKILTADQDVLNCMGRGRTLELHPRWNHNDGLLIKQFQFSVFSKRRYRGKRGVEVIEAILKPGILHYWGKNKPWRKNHRPERKRYCNLIRELGLSSGDFGVPANTLLGSMGLCFYDAVHCLLRVVARIRLAIWRLAARR